MRILFSLALAALLAACSPPPDAPIPADVIIYNADAWTGDDAMPRATTVAITNGRWVAYGNRREDLRAYMGADTEHVDYGGRQLLPPLIDAHYHLRGVGERELTLDLADHNGSLPEMLATVQAWAEANPDAAWVTGRGWIETHYDPPVFPTREDLDAIIPDRPVWLSRADGHASLANTRALELAGITRDTEAPQGGAILRDENGDATGMFIDTAQYLVGRHVPNDGRPEVIEALRVGGLVAQRQGWAGVHAILDSWEEVEALRELYRRNEMPITVYAALRWPSEGAERLLESGPLPSEFGGRFTVRAIKINFDGALGSRGAALFEPYADDPDNTGLLTHDPEAVRPVLERALRNGIQVWTHAIGDRANHIVLNLYEEAFNTVPVSERRVTDPRWRIEHVQHLHPDDIPRFAQLGVIASVQPSHAIGDLHFAGRRLGLERLQYAYAWRMLIDSGAVVIGGSDAPVEVGDPEIEFHAATTRTDLNGYSGEGWHPEQAVTMHEAVKMFSRTTILASFDSR